MGIIRRSCTLYGGSDGCREEETDNGPPHLEEDLKDKLLMNNEVLLAPNLIYV
jgi:hypothetical protein